MSGKKKTAWWKHIILFPLWLPFYLYNLSQRRLYYITGTGVTTIGDRIYWRVVLTTQKDMIPMKSLEAKMKKELDLTMAIILNWRPISKKIATYIEKDYECRINDKKDY